MATKTEKVDGDISLTDIKDRCERIQGGGFQISAIKGEEETVGTDILLFNVTEFKSKMANKILKKLTFVKVGNKNPEDIKMEMKDEGQTLLCDVSEIFASRDATKVMVFGKN